MALDSNDVARRMRMEILILHAFLRSPESSGVDLDAWDLVSHKLLMTSLYVIPLWAMIVYLLSVSTFVITYCFSGVWLRVSNHSKAVAQTANCPIFGLRCEYKVKLITTPIKDLLILFLTLRPDCNDYLIMIS